MHCFACFLLFLFIPNTFGSRQYRTLYQKISNEAQYMKFNDFVQKSRDAKLNLMYSNTMTVFVPGNNVQIDDKYDNLPLYHMSFDLFPLKSLRNVTKIESTVQNYPPLWISKTGEGAIFVNNERVLAEKSDVFSEDREQVLHMLNGTLNPQIKTLFANATAYDFLRFSSKYWHSTFTTHNFFARVLMFNLEELYRDKTLQNTYFLPVDVANEDRTFQQIDSYIIQAHIIPNQVLFLNPTKTDFVYETECNGDFVYIVVSFVRKTKNFIKSYTVLGDEKHRKGEVLSEIVQANIPLQNGVVHLIKKPLAVFEKELKLFPYLDISYKISSDPYLSRTYEIGQQIGLNTIFANGNSSTFFVYFAPRNRAWDELLSQSPGSLSGVLGRHLVVSRSILTMDDLVLLSKDQGVVLTTKSGSVRFKFSKIESHFYVEWRQKQIKVQRPNYVCTDGIVHVVDGVFGDLDEIDENPVEINNNVGNDTFWALLKNTVMNV